MKYKNQINAIEAHIDQNDYNEALLVIAEEILKSYRFSKAIESIAYLHTGFYGYLDGDVAMVRNNIRNSMMLAIESVVTGEELIKIRELV